LAPAERIFEDVDAVAFQILIVSEDLIVIPLLPRELGLSARAAAPAL
jgi:hypothetical protein